jgi:hypothetical protein
MRARSTWQSEKSETPRQAATSRTADIYTMNQEHPQPSPVDYENGDPDSWAETPVPADKMSVKEEYDGDHVKRNEIGLGEFRDDTYKHKDSDKWNGKGKYDNAKMAAERKAMACERIARATLRTADEKLVEGAAIDLMALPDKSLVAMLKRLDTVSPDSLPEQQKFKRALACTKLAARMLGAAATPETVEKLGSVIMTIDDPTLRSMIKTIAAATTHVAQQDDEQQGGKTSQVKVQGQEQEDEEQAGKTSQVKVQGQEEEQQDQTAQVKVEGQEEQEEEQQEQTSQEDQAHGLSPEEMAMLDSMLQEEGCAPGAAAPPAAGAAAPAAPAPTAPPADDLSALFSGPSAAPAPMPMMASDISFDDGEDEATTAAPVVAAASTDLDSLFADDPEVQAQREITAANAEARARESGFGGRTASTKGAKKLGAVQKPAKASVENVLEGLWDRP